MTSPSRSSSTLSRTESLTLLALTGACVTILANAFLYEDDDTSKPLIVSLALSGLAFSATYALIRWLGPTFMRVGFKGVDMAKVNRREIPECMGAVCAAVYLLAIIVFIPFVFYKDVVAATSGGGNRDVVVSAVRAATGDGTGQEVQGRFLHRFPHSKVSFYLTFVLLMCGCNGGLLTGAAFIIPLGYCLTADGRLAGAGRRPLRHSLAAQVLHPRLRSHPAAGRLPRRLWRDLDRRPAAATALPRPAHRPRCAVLRLHGGRGHLLAQQHQHPSRHQRHRSEPVTGHRRAARSQRRALPTLLTNLSRGLPAPAPSDGLPPVLAVLPAAISSRLSRAVLPQPVPGPRLRRRHVLLLRRHGFRGCQHPRPLQQDAVAAAAPTGVQFPLLDPAAVWAYPLPAPPPAAVQCPYGATRAEHDGVE